MSTGKIQVVFDGPPGHESGRFVELERDGVSVREPAEWVEMGDGLWALELPDPVKLQDELDASRLEVIRLREALLVAASMLDQEGYRLGSCARKAAGEGV